MNKQTDPIIIFVRGLPGSGKSHLTSALENNMGSKNVVTLDPDKINYSSKKYLEHKHILSAEGVDKQLHPYRFLRAKAYKAIEQDQIIIWNQPFTNLEIFRKMIARMKDHAKDNGKTLGILLVEVCIDMPTAIKRVKQRKKEGGHGTSYSTFNQTHNEYVSFAGEGIKTVSVDGTDDVTKSVATVMTAIENLS